ncbi:alpha/beta hydrolase [Celeribacter litoreus]|uniref:alpha/beta hydrolase n=1 Tax=Celeribacter litoreus TaxID=2876714 RepID=UPI001CCB21FD|nr:alpha/beta hydrolase [Celeribacter litoreus]MCA0045004.1 alpha/beta hydrolase [Celeribacter litoreus]
MNRRNLIIGALASFFDSILSVFAGPRVEVRSYGPAKLDIYRTDGARGALIYVHGGAWRFGSRRKVDAKPEWAAAQGLHFISIDYPMLPETPVPDQISAVRQAIDWCFENIAPPENTIVMGHSAGAHLAAMATLTGWDPRPAGVILNDSGALDLLTLSRAYNGTLPKPVRQAFPDEDTWERLSPAYRLAAPLPAILAIHSRARGHAKAIGNFVALARAEGAPIAHFDGSAYRHSPINRQIGTGKFPKLDSALTGFIRRVV